MPLPEPRKVLRHLLRAAVRREQVEDERKPALHDGGTALHAEEVLQARMQRRRVAGGVLHPDPPAGGERDRFGSETVEQRGCARAGAFEDRAS